MKLIPDCHPTEPYYSSKLCKTCYNKREKTPEQKEAHRLAAKKYRERNRGLIAEREKQKHINSLARKKVEKLISNAKKRAVAKGMECDITVDDLYIPTVCPVLGISLDSSSRDNCLSLDRINNKKGYIKGNVVVVSLRANRIKSDAAFVELRQIVNFYNDPKKFNRST